MPLAVLFRDSQVVVVDKPAGLAVDEDVAPLVAREIAPPGGRSWPRIVHRLDRGTSGCLLFALRKESEQALKRALDEGTVEKGYLALVQGSPPDEARLDTPYGPDPADRRRHTTRIETPRRARLAYEVVERFRDAALLRIELDTGRTHQIRVQLSESGFPVVGDDVYNPATAVNRPGDTMGAARRDHVPDAVSRLMLHAGRLVFPHPRTGARIECTAPTSREFEECLARYQHREPAAEAGSARGSPKGT